MERPLRPVCHRDASAAVDIVRPRRHARLLGDVQVEPHCILACRSTPHHLRPFQHQCPRVNGGRCATDDLLERIPRQNLALIGPWPGEGWRGVGVDPRAQTQTILLALSIPPPLVTFPKKPSTVGRQRVSIAVLPDPVVADLLPCGLGQDEGDQEEEEQEEEAPVSVGRKRKRPQARSKKTPAAQGRKQPTKRRRGEEEKAPAVTGRKRKQAQASPSPKQAAPGRKQPAKRRRSVREQEEEEEEEEEEQEIPVVVRRNPPQISGKRAAQPRKKPAKRQRTEEQREKKREYMRKRRAAMR
mmetsp:Transcript_30873/g.89662  ORF Transcript_30873/g.89662 Transcript_30873/m.89662 type:complete len:299 (+) Transcript_30873:1250-2146(+)